jgi:hypothetical protein
MPDAPVNEHLVCLGLHGEAAGNVSTEDAALNGLHLATDISFGGNHAALVEALLSVEALVGAHDAALVRFHLQEYHTSAQIDECSRFRTMHTVDDDSKTDV